MLNNIKKAPAQYILIALMLLCYGLSLIYGKFVFLALILQLLVGSVQVVQASIISKRHHSAWHKNYVMAAITYFFILLVSYFGVMNLESMAVTNVYLALMVCFLPSAAAVYYAHHHYETYLH